MRHLNPGGRGWWSGPTVALACMILASMALAACGSRGSGDAAQLLKDTFSGSHRINSGNLRLSLNVNPSGSTTLTGPIALSFGGPFQSLGPGRIPQSNFILSTSALGSNGSLGIVSTGSAGYVTLQGTSYQLPQSTFQRLESSFSQLTSSTGSGSSASTLNKLGIHPMNWLVKPTIVGDESVAGTPTTHIHARVNVGALLNDLGMFLRKAASSGVTGATQLSGGLSTSSRATMAKEIQNPSVDVWTGKGDKTLRRLSINLTLPVTGQISTALGGLRSAALWLTLQYSSLNQPQTITAPTTVRPYSEFQSKMRTFAQGIQSGLGAIAGAGGTGSASTGAGATSTGAGATSSGTGVSSSGAAKNVQAYSRCIQAAGSDVAKMQQCAPLLNG